MAKLPVADRKPGDVGRLVGIARRDARKAPMEVCQMGVITLDAGLLGDHKGLKYKKRAITVLALEDWRLALREAALAGGLHDGAEFERIATLEWTTRRANLLVEGVELPKAPGGRLQIGAAVALEVTYPCQPCRRMDEAFVGLLKAMHPDWRGGVVMKVVAGGAVAVGDRVEVTQRPARIVRRLP